MIPISLLKMLPTINLTLIFWKRMPWLSITKVYKCIKISPKFDNWQSSSPVGRYRLDITRLMTGAGFIKHHQLVSMEFKNKYCQRRISEREKYLDDWVNLNKGCWKILFKEFCYFLLNFGIYFWIWRILRNGLVCLGELYVEIPWKCLIICCVTFFLGPFWSDFLKLNQCFN